MAAFACLVAYLLPMRAAVAGPMGYNVTALNGPNASSPGYTGSFDFLNDAGQVGLTAWAGATGASVDYSSKSGGIIYKNQGTSIAERYDSVGPNAGTYTPVATSNTFAWGLTNDGKILVNGYLTDGKTAALA